MSSESGLVLDGLTIGPFGRPMLESVSLTVPRGSSLALLGGAGSGKSTILAALAGRRRPEAGSIRLDGAALDRSLIGFVEQQHHLPDGLTAAEHLMVPLLARGIRPDGWSGIELLLTRLGLPPSAHHNLLEELSGGQQQRVAVARALVGRPRLICLDDPVSELDHASAELVWAALRDAAADQDAVVVVTTSRSEDASRLDHVLEITHSRRGDQREGAAPRR